MSASTVDPLEMLIRDAGEGWMLDAFPQPRQGVEVVREVLNAVNDYARQRFGEAAPQFTPESLGKTQQKDPLHVRAFLQAVTATRTPQMLLMVWRIIQGMRIGKVEMRYCSESEFLLNVELESPYEGAGPELYRSNDIDDAALLRHFGIMKLDGKPVFDGFFPLRLK